jgi:hypothetical protein
MVTPDATPTERPGGSAPLGGASAGTGAPQMPAEDDFDALQSILRFVVGGVLEGSDEAVRRLKAQEGRLRASGAALPPVEHEETDADRARYAVIGMVFEGADVLRSGLTRWQHTVTSATSLASHVVKPVANSRLAQPWQRRVDEWAERGADIVERWIQTGRIEEPHSRALMLATATQAIDDTFDVLGENEGVQEIIQRQSVGMTTMMVGEARERAATADTFLERFTHRLLRRPLPSAGAPAAGSGGPEGAGPAQRE